MIVADAGASRSILFLPMRNAGIVGNKCGWLLAGRKQGTGVVLRIRNIKRKIIPRVNKTVGFSWAEILSQLEPEFPFSGLLVNQTGGASLDRGGFGDFAKQRAFAVRENR